MSAMQVPHAALRAYVMGERGGDPLESPTETELVGWLDSW